jgi:hypothetical protein
MLQKRHDLRNSKDSDLERQQLKLILNGAYGFFAIQATNFPRTRLVRESYLKNIGFRHRLGMAGDNVIQVTLLGAVRKEGKKPDLLYAVTSRRPEEKICNIIQAACAILSQSRIIFLGKILTILRCFDPRMVELCYTGEDFSDFFPVVLDNFFI